MNTVIDAKSPAELPEYYMLFVDDVEFAMRWLELRADILKENKIRVVVPLDMYRYNGTLAIRLEAIE